MRRLTRRATNTLALLGLTAVLATACSADVPRSQTSLAPQDEADALRADVWAAYPPTRSLDSQVLAAADDLLAHQTSLTMADEDAFLLAVRLTCFWIDEPGSLDGYLELLVDEGLVPEGLDERGFAMWATTLLGGASVVCPDHSAELERWSAAVHDTVSENSSTTTLPQLEAKHAEFVGRLRDASAQTITKDSVTWVDRLDDVELADTGDRLCVVVEQFDDGSEDLWIDTLWQIADDLAAAWAGNGFDTSADRSLATSAMFNATQLLCPEYAELGTEAFDIRD